MPALAALLACAALWLGLLNTDAGAKPPTLLLSPAALAAANALIVDIRPEKAFRKGHIPNAVSAPYPAFGWRTTRYGRPAVLPAPEALAKRLSTLGLTRHTPAVIVSDDIGLGALVFWTMKSLGHGPLSLLDGGFGAWRAAGRALAKGAGVALPPARYEPKPNPAIVADEEFVTDLYDNVRLAIDCRSELFWGGEKGGPAQDDFGTIKEALNLDSRRLLTADGRFRPLGELRAVFARKWVLDDRTAFFGYDGRHAAICWFALHELAGNSRARLYDGGIVDWEKNGHDIWNLQDGMGAR